MKLSVSLLDVLTCGFGGVLLLFLTTIAVWQISSHTTASAQKKADGAHFVLLVMNEKADQPLFDNPAEDLWESIHFPVLGAEITPSFAVLYSNKEPNESQQLKLTGLRINQNIRCQIIIGGEITTKRLTTDDPVLTYERLAGKNPDAISDDSAETTPAGTTPAETTPAGTAPAGQGGTDEQ